MFRIMYRTNKSYQDRDNYWCTKDGDIEAFTADTRAEVLDWIKMKCIAFAHEEAERLFREDYRAEHMQDYVLKAKDSKKGIKIHGDHSLEFISPIFEFKDDEDYGESADWKNDSAEMMEENLIKLLEGARSKRIEQAERDARTRAAKKEIDDRAEFERLKKKYEG